jgi:hypothetical protein
MTSSAGKCAAIVLPYCVSMGDVLGAQILDLEKGGLWVHTRSIMTSFRVGR